MSRGGHPTLSHENCSGQPVLCAQTTLQTKCPSPLVSRPWITADLWQALVLIQGCPSATHVCRGGSPKLELLAHLLSLNCLPAPCCRCDPVRFLIANSNSQARGYKELLYSCALALTGAEKTATAASPAAQMPGDHTIMGWEMLPNQGSSNKPVSRVLLSRFCNPGFCYPGFCYPGFRYPGFEHFRRPRLWGISY